MMTWALDATQIQSFHHQGFVRIDQVFSPEEMDRIDAACERLHAVAERVAPKPPAGQMVTHGGARFTFSPHGHVRHIAFCGNVEPDLLRFGRDPRLLAIAAALLESPAMDHLINQVHYKRPGSAVAFDWHQDCAHRGIARGGFVDVNGRGSYVQIALAIDDATSDNGPLEFIPRSNQHGPLSPEALANLDVSGKVAPLLRRGDVVAFGPFTVHGSQANLSRRSRRVFINGYAYPGANRRDYGLPHAGDRLTAH